MEFPSLYKLTSTSQVQTWQIFVENNHYYTIEGILNGKLTQSMPTICAGKNIGKKNETTPDQQALLEAQSKFQKKLDKGYAEVLGEGTKFFEPMLAFKRKNYEKLLFTVPTFVSPKLDGVRVILKEGKLFSREGNPILSCPHLELEDLLLDGELYNHDLKHDFNRIISLTRQSKPTLQDFEDAKIIEFWVYDFPNLQEVYSKRYDAYNSLDLPVSYKKVPCYPVYSVEDIEAFHLKFIEEGYEGTMIRLDLGSYANKRSKQLLKYKNFMDEEFEILDVIEGEGNRSGVAGKLVVKVPNGDCKVSMTGNLEFMRQVLVDKHKFIGKQCTVKFFGWTEAGKLRFPTLKTII